MVGFDFFPTYCEWAGIPEKKLPAGIEGGSIASLLAHDGKGSVKRPREELVFHFPHYQSDDGPHSAIFIGDLKLIRFYEDDRVALFDISKDIREQNDLAKQMPRDAQRLNGRLTDYLKSVKAQYPTSNPNFDPSKPAAPVKKGGKRGEKGKE